MELLFTSSFITCHSSARMCEGYGKSPCVSVCLSVCVCIKLFIEQLRKTKHTNGITHPLLSLFPLKFPLLCTLHCIVGQPNYHTPNFQQRDKRVLYKQI